MYRIDLEDDHHLLVLDGSLTVETSPTLKSLLTDLDGGRDLVVDASGLEYIDSSGVACLLIAYKKLTANGHSLILRAPSEALLAVLKVMKFQDLFKTEA